MNTDDRLSNHNTPGSDELSADRVAYYVRLAHQQRSEMIGDALSALFNLPCQLISRIRMNRAQASAKDGLTGQH